MSRTKSAAAAEAAAAEPIAEQAELGEAVAGELVGDDAAPVAADATPEPAAEAPAEQPAADTVQVSAQVPVRLRAAVLFAFCDAVQVGCIVSGSALEIRALTESGNVDPHPDAVAAREAAGAVHVEL